LKAGTSKAAFPGKNRAFHIVQGDHMETPTAVEIDKNKTGDGPPAAGRRRRRNGEESGARFFLPKPGSTLKTPELGREFAKEGDALVEAFKKDQHFYVVTAWRAESQQTDGAPVIVKQPVNDPEKD
jgi:hypothetical protein